MSLIALAVLIASQSTTTSPPVIEPLVVQRSTIDMPVLGGEPLHCEGAARQVVFPAPSATRPIGSVVQRTFTPAEAGSDQRVRMYHLLDRSIAGCPVPVVAMDHLPEADRAVGRFVGGFVPPR